MKKNIYDYTLSELEFELSQKNERLKPFHFREIFKWLYKKDCKSFADMTTLPLILRDYLGKNYSLKTGSLQKILIDSDDNTKKLIIKL